MTDVKISQLTATTSPKDTDLAELSSYNGATYDSRKVTLSNLKSFVTAYINVASKTTSYIATLSDTVLLCDATSGSITITLPAAAASSGKVFYIKKTNSNANAVTIDGNSSETIDGDLTQIITTQYDSVTVVCDGVAWYVI